MLRRSAAVLLLVLLVVWLGPDRPRGWLGSPEQRAQRLFDRDRHAEAAPLFTDPARRGTAWYRAGEFERAAAAWALVDSPAASFNRGNALLMQGDYGTAVEAYDRALATAPAWAAPATNRAIALVRQARLDRAGAERGEASELGSDDVVFDADAGDRPAGDPAPAAQGASDEALRALWLRRVSTRPGDFLALRFAAQLAAGDGEGAQ